MGEAMALLPPQRHRRILGLLTQAESVRVSELAKTLHVTEETIRRDLQKLEESGRLVRTHGGATAIAGGSRDLPFEVRQTANLELKVAIAHHALNYISENDIIGLDASSTVFELARRLPDWPLTVVTNSLVATAALSTSTNTRVVSTGGMLDPRSRSWTGLLAEHGLERLNIHKLFMSTRGIDLERGLSEVDDQQARMKRQLMERADKVFLLADHSKLGVRAVVGLAALTEVDVVLTDTDAEESFLTARRAAGRQVERAPRV